MISTTGTDNSIGGLLFPGVDGPVQIERALEERSVLERVTDELGGLSKVLVGAMAKEIATVVAGLLGIDVVDVLVSGWKKYARLVDAANETLQAPGTRALVELETHRVRSTYPSSIDVLLDDVSVGSIDLQLDIEIVVQAVVAVVADGRLIALRSGRAEVEAELSCEGRPIKSARKGFDLALEIGLGAGIPLAEPPSHVRLPDAPI